MLVDKLINIITVDPLIENEKDKYVENLIETQHLNEGN